MPIYAYLTIDDGPSSHFLDKLNLLDQNHIPAVWFCKGSHLEKRPDMAIEAIRRGHVIGNHSYSHPSFEDISIDQGCAEIRTTDAIIAELYSRAGVPQKHHYFRFPYGNKGSGYEQADNPEKVEKREAFQTYLGRLGYTPAPIDYLNYPELKDTISDLDWLWTYESRDWAPFNPSIAPPTFDTTGGVLTALQNWTPCQQSDPLQEPVANMILMHDFSGTMAYELFSNMVKVLVEKEIHFLSCAD